MLYHHHFPPNQNLITWFIPVLRVSAVRTFSSGWCLGDSSGSTESRSSQGVALGRECWTSRVSCHSDTAFQKSGATVPGGVFKHGPWPAFWLMELVDFVHLSMVCMWEEQRNARTETDLRIWVFLESCQGWKNTFTFTHILFIDDRYKRPFVFLLIYSVLTFSFWGLRLKVKQWQSNLFVEIQAGNNF